jgi:CDGSH-type Zn-finger protein
MPVTIRVRPNGPLIIEGDAKIVDQHGGEFTPRPDKPKIALCRCGQSSSKPFCDGTHTRCGFVASEVAGPQSMPGDPRESRRTEN